jgi:hypothetical protein
VRRPSKLVFLPLDERFHLAPNSAVRRWAAVSAAVPELHVDVVDPDGDPERALRD